MKIVNFLGVFAVVLALVSCGNSKTEREDSSNAALEMLDDAASQTEQVMDDASAETSYSEEESESSDGEDWDSLLDSYEEYVDMYISLLKKASAGDLSAVSEYTSYMSKAQEVSQKMADATSKLSPAQLSRFNKINQKMLQAAQNMN
ncbi:hypothetical protein QUW50_06270 [Barnesiella viscericola]|uniref:DUF6591 domain-containing protein n=1 Tax=Barnesiella viscericola TaxID=397865 RepID=UPI0025A34C3F|nr:DUF6591 domain-containing protein [Barnesiella viscericola]MDM8268642.1 hypothetical protein [Barnesiella viscericola]